MNQGELDWLDWREVAPRRGCLPPEPGEVHVWQFELTPAADDEALLDSAELARMRRFVQARDRARYLAAHGWTRRILGAYLDRPATALRFARAADGKPRLDGAALRFNLSHSASIGLLAVGVDAELGVDVEAWREVDATLADAVLSAGERATLRGRAPDAARLLGCWTRKEACLKALGCGLLRDPRGIDVGVDGGTRVVLGVELRALPLPDGYSAALAVVGGCRRTRLLRARRTAQ